MTLFDLLEEMYELLIVKIDRRLVWLLNSTVAVGERIVNEFGMRY